MRCRKLAWLSYHDREAPELRHDADAEMRIAEGRVVGAEARRQRGEGAHVAPERTVAQATVVERTRAAMADGAARIYEAGLSGGGAGVRADILERDPERAPGRADDAWTLIEVKSSKWPAKDNDREKKFALHVPDVAIQAWAADQAGVPVSSVHLMYLNPDCEHPRLESLFTAVDVSSRIAPVVATMPEAMRTLRETLEMKQAPQVAVGEQCDDPEQCPFYDRCHEPLPDHHVSELYYAKRHAAKFVAEGKTLISHLTEADAPTAPAKRQVRAVKSRERVVERGLSEKLAALKAPIYHLDFETVQLAVPRWRGCRPQDMVAAQFSVHRELGDGQVQHLHHLASRGEADPRPALIAALVDACRGAGTILVYYEQFEKSRLAELATWFPEHAADLHDIRDRIVDLLPIVRDHVYDPAFHGSFSLKTVLPALVPDLGYGDLEIQEGSTAAAEIYRLLFAAELDPVVEADLRRDLLAYCQRDTEAMVRLLATLRTLAA